jgi:hypothetical protein
MLGMVDSELDLSELPGCVHNRCSTSADGWLDLLRFQLAFPPREQDPLRY